MARLRFVLEVESADGAPSATIHRLLVEHLLDWPDNRPSPGGNFSLTPYLPDPVDAHGKHGMADGAGYVPYADLHKHARVVNVGMADARPATIHQPEERPATCACYVGSGATPYAHEPSCPVHPRYADTQLLEFNGEVQEFHTSLLDGSKCDGKRANLEAEYLGALASLKARGAANGALYRIHELGKSLGRSVHGVCADFNR